MTPRVRWGVAWLWDCSLRKLESYSVEFHFQLYLCVVYSRAGVGEHSYACLWRVSVDPVRLPRTSPYSLEIGSLSEPGIVWWPTSASDVLSPLQPLPCPPGTL